MRKIEASIVADSIDPRGHRITTMLLTFPRFILPELNTHRLFTKNSASSRAIPAKKMFESVETDPFIPIAWQKEHSGMQGTEYFEHPDSIRVVEATWKAAADSALSCSKALNSIKVTKQLTNRLLEPFLWHTVLLTSTEFENFFDLRTPKYCDKIYTFSSKEDYVTANDLNSSDEVPENYWRKINSSQAEIHIQALAESMWVALKHSKPVELQPGSWHVPFGDQMDINALHDYGIVECDNVYDVDQLRIAVASARCARLSYMTFDGEMDYGKDILLHDGLLEKKHMSPFEHCARVMTDAEYGTLLKGEISMIPREGFVPHPFIEDIFIEKSSLGWCNNFRGFIQYRHLIEKNKSL